MIIISTRVASHFPTAKKPAAFVQLRDEPEKKDEKALKNMAKLMAKKNGLQLHCRLDSIFKAPYDHVVVFSQSRRVFWRFNVMHLYLLVLSSIQYLYN